MSQSPTDKITPENTLLYRQGWKALNRLLHEDRSFSGYERNCAFLNCGGKTFADISSISGFDFLDDARAIALVDWDFDGDLDVWQTARTAPRLRLLKNDAKTNKSWLALKLIGNGSSTNRDAIGARVELVLEGIDVPLIRTLHAGDAFLSQSSSWIHFGLPEGAKPKLIVVKWPGGITQTIDQGIEFGKRYHLSQGNDLVEWNPNWKRKELEVTKPELPEADPTARIVLSGRLPLPSIYISNEGSVSELPFERQQGPLLINLWAHWCLPCRQELKEWTDHAKEIKEAGLKILALNSEADKSDYASKVLKSMAFPFESMDVTLDTVRNLDIFHQSTLDRWTDLPVPSSFLMDKTGRVAVIYKGPVSIEQLLQDVQLLDADPVVVRESSVPFPGMFVYPPTNANPLLVNSQFVSYNEVDEGIKYLKKYANVANQTGGISNKMLGDIQYIIGVIEQSNQNWKESEAYFAKAEQLLPGDLRVLRDLGDVFLSQGKTDEAIKSLKKAYAVNKDSIEVKRLLGKAYYLHANNFRDQGQEAEAINYYKETLKTNGQLLDAANNLAYILATSRDPQIKSLNEAAALGIQLNRMTREQNPQFLDTLAIVFAAQGNYPEAIKTIDKALAIVSESTDSALIEKLKSHRQLFIENKPFQP